MLQLTRWQVWNPLEKPPNYRGKYGEHYTDKTGPHKKPATLIDAPHMNPAFNSSQIFETADLDLRGETNGYNVWIRSMGVDAIQIWILQTTRSRSQENGYSLRDISKSS